jgi:hypothetical protein
MRTYPVPQVLASSLALSGALSVAAADLASRVGQPADIASSAYQYRADRRAEENPPEAWVLLIQHAGLPYDQPVNPAAPAVRQVLCGLLWEEVRPVRRVELEWPATATAIPAPEALVLTTFDATDGTAHTWWNPRSLKDAGKPEVSADGRCYAYAIPVDTWGLVVAVRGDRDASSYAVPTVRALVPELWKRADLEIEWGFAEATAALDYGGRIEGYDAVIADVHPLAGDSGTTLTGAQAWHSAGPGSGRRGVHLSVLYLGSSRWRRVWPYHAQPDDVARSIVTVWTASGNFSFQVADLEAGPILAPEYGFFVRATALTQAPAGAAAPALLPAVVPALLAEKMDEIPGVPRTRGWASNTIPWFGANADLEPGVAGTLTVPARSVAMHPSPTLDVAVGWCSPLAGRVSVQAKVAMGDSAGGNGVDWALVLENAAGRQILAAGAIGTGSAEVIPAAADAGKLAAIAVEPGNLLSLVIGAKGGDHVCDTTIVGLVLREVGGQGRVWDLTRDVVDSIHAGNPHADGLGQADVWRFYAAAAGQLAPPQPAPSEPPFSQASSAATATAFVQELAGRNLRTIRERVREHGEQTWEGAVAAMRPGEDLPPHPVPPLAPAMEVEVPSARLTAQWKLGAWHILRRSVKDANGTWHFNDFPFGILSSETYMLLRALDLQGMHQEAADGLDQWLRLPTDPTVVPGQGGHHGWARPDRPLGHFADGHGCLTHAEGPPGAGGHMDGVHSMGPGAIAFAAGEHFLLTGDLDWLRSRAARLRANAEWILRQRQVLTGNLPGGSRLWSKGLQPAHVVTPDSECMHMQFYESEAYYWLAVARTAELLARVDPEAGAKLAAAAEAYRLDLLAAVERSIALTPVVAVRDGTYHSFIPFAPYVRGFAAGAWGWRRCQGHVGAIYWDTVQSADPLVSPSGLLSPTDPRVQGHLDVLEDRLLLENPKVNARTPGYDPERDWFAHASWQYQCGLERHANIHLAADDAPNAIRTVLNQYAVDIMPGEYTFREHTTGGPPDKIYEESCFLERFRQMLVMEDGASLWLARATPRAWLAQGARIAVRQAPTHFGPVAYALVSDVDHGRITATLELPRRNPPKVVLLRLRHPQAAPIRSVTVKGTPWTAFDPAAELVRLEGVVGDVKVEVSY